jgi:hypothetical protein
MRLTAGSGKRYNEGSWASSTSESDAAPTSCGRFLSHGLSHRQPLKHGKDCVIQAANQIEVSRREQVFLQLERTLRAMDTLPAEQRMARLRELAAGDRLSPPPGPPSDSQKSLDRASQKETEQRRIRQLKRLCQRFLLSRHTSRSLLLFVEELLAKRSKHVLRLSPSLKRLSPLQEIIWNISPFFRHSDRTDPRRSGHIAWEDVVQFLVIAQESERVAVKKRAAARVVTPSNRFKNEADRLRRIYQHIQDQAPQTPYARKIASLLARHTGPSLT